jgi:hypothetical protein
VPDRQATQVGRRRFRLGFLFHDADEAVTPAWQRLDVPRIVGGIAQRIAQPLNRCVDAVVELDDGVVGPQHLAQLFAGHQLARPVQQHDQDSERLLVEANLDPVLAQLGGLNVEFERAEAEDASQNIPFETSQNFITAS